MDTQEVKVPRDELRLEVIEELVTPPYLPYTCHQLQVC